MSVSPAASAIFAAATANPAKGLTVVGLCGAQGSGKSTLGRAVMTLCAEHGIAAATLSLDDLYLTRAERLALARDVHPLLATRGVPGTHDLALGQDVFLAMARGEPVALPSFDKATDDRRPRSEWQRAPRDCRVLLFEGWCIGARPQTDDELTMPINELEATEDRAGTWRRYANDALEGPYQELFGWVGPLAMLAAPSFDAVFAWRQQQEDELRGSNGDGVMDEPAVARFIRHYERLTRHMLAEMPGRADILIRLAADRTPIEIRTAAAPR